MIALHLRPGFDPDVEAERIYKLADAIVRQALKRADGMPLQSTNGHAGQQDTPAPNEET